MKRLGWLDVVGKIAAARALSPGERAALGKLDEALFDLWNLGENLVLVWTHAGRSLRVLPVHHNDIAKRPGSLFNEILAGPKHVAAAEFERVCALLGRSGVALDLGYEPGGKIAVELISSLINRYGVSLVRDRAVVLLDAVGFSLRPPLEQVMMVNSMAYSVNCAFRQLASKDEYINVARTTTGDGFYIWNRVRGADGNIALYKLMMLILADNAIAQKKAGDKVPELRAAFHIGEHYEFYQVEGFNPTAFSYIVGEVTVTLSRMVGQALPGQIVLGDFNTALPGVSAQQASHATLEFVEQAAASLDALRGLVIAGDQIEDIRCYLTGDKASGSRFAVSRYWVADKHGIAHCLYNAKINIHRYAAEPIFLGLQHNAMANFPAAQVEVLMRERR